MNFSTSHLKRYREIAALMWRYGRSDLVRQMRSSQDFATDLDEMPADGEISPDRLADDLEGMGPTFVKLGQVLSSRPDLLPAAYLTALARLQDRVKPFPSEQVEAIVMSELGVRLSKAFSRFDPEPLAAASLGQVHLAALRDGRAVVVKVQRPDIRRQIAEDFEVLAHMAKLLDEYTDVGRRTKFGSILEEFRLTIQQELNYEREAQNLATVRENLKEFERIEIPQPIPDYCTRAVLTMDWVSGRKISSLSPLAHLELDGSALAETLLRAYLKQVLVDGLFHADPHPGNVFITENNKIALLDLGMVGHTAPGMQENLLKLLAAVSDGSGEDAADIVVQVSEKLGSPDLVEFRRRTARLVVMHRDRGMAQMNIGRSLMDVCGLARSSGLFVPGELILLGKTLMQLSDIGRILDPNFQPTATIRSDVDRLMAQRMQRDLTRGSLVTALLETKDFMSNLPARLNRIMDAVTNSTLEVKVKAVDAQTMLDGMQKIANRITAGTILAALIIGAALLMRVNTRFQLFGYPGLAILCFLAAATGACWLLINIFIKDHNSRKNSSG